MTYKLSDEQREILGREIGPEDIDAYAASVIAHGDIAALETKIDIIAAAKSPHPYDEMRRRAYPTIGDQLDDLYHKGVFSDGMTAQLKAVKATYPKPE